jgi:hypothetical protein
MGEIADDIIDGFYCQICGEVIDGEESGYPRSCAGCGGGDCVDFDFSESDSAYWRDVEKHFDFVKKLRLLKQIKERRRRSNTFASRI